MVAEVLEFPDWKRQLVRRKNGDIQPDERNVEIALAHAPPLARLLFYDEFRDRIYLRRPLPNMPRDSLDQFFGDDEPAPWADEHLTLLLIWLLEQGFVSLRRYTVQDTVIAFAKRDTVHPVRSYLEEVRGTWDGQGRLATWLKTYLGAKDHAAYLEAVGSKFMIGAVARVMQPGCQMDSMLVLEGGQGTGKSSAVAVLGHEWTADVTGDLASKDAAIHIQGVWLGEMSELSALRRSEQESIKGFISRRIDRYRPPYGRNAVDRPRQCCFIATTNENDYLKDPTGARRFWPVECGNIDLPSLRRDRDQLWGEALARFKERLPWHLTGIETRSAAIEQAARHPLSPVDCVVLEYADTLLASGVRIIEMRQLLRDLFDLDTREDCGRAGALATQAARALTREGWIRLKPVGRGRTRKQQYRFDGEAETALSAKNSQGSQGISGENADVPF